MSEELSLRKRGIDHNKIKKIEEEKAKTKQKEKDRDRIDQIEREKEGK